MLICPGGMGGEEGGCPARAVRSGQPAALQRLRQQRHAMALLLRSSVAATPIFGLADDARHTVSSSGLGCLRVCVAAGPPP